MRQRKNIRGRNRRGRPKEQGTVIVLVAVFMLFVVGAMAALSIDVTTMYTARSEAQLVADSAALAGARVLANSGATSDASGLSMGAAQTLASNVAIQVAQSSMVGGRYLVASAGEVTVSFTGSGCVSTSPTTNPYVCVKVQRTDLPSFFARLLGRTQVAVAASATAEAYNPSGATGTATSSAPPVAPLCVKPWLLPNMDPSNSSQPIFDPRTGAVTAGSKLLGWNSMTSQGGVPLTSACTGGTNGTCTTTLPGPLLWTYYPGADDAADFPHPTSAQPACNPALTTGYQESVAGCIQVPISCSSSSTTPINIDLAQYPASGREADTTTAVNCLTHVTNNAGDVVAGPVPFEFTAGTDNPIAVANPTLAAQQIMVSDSLVTVPVIDNNTFNASAGSAFIIGFVQLFLNPNGQQTTTPPQPGAVNSMVINLVGCGTNNTTPAILGNGASPVAVRLISH